MTARVLVVCDNPNHARGKVAKVAEYVVADDGEVSIRFYLRRDRNRRTMSRASRAAADAFDGTPESVERVREAAKAAMRTGVDAGRECKLCGRRLPAETPALHRVIRRLADDGVTTLSLSDLVARVRIQEQQ